MVDRVAGQVHEAVLLRGVTQLGWQPQLVLPTQGFLLDDRDPWSWYCSQPSCLGLGELVTRQDLVRAVVDVS
jgi:hypothetical protein